MLTCHICHQAWNAHAVDCRVHSDLERMRRTYDRMMAAGRTDDILPRMKLYLDRFGSLDCQLRDAPPSPADCAACGHASVCVLIDP
jgi:hypothetical protein